MDFSEFASGYRARTVQAHVDRSEAMRVCDHSPALPRRYRSAHLVGKNLARLLIVGGLISPVWIPWWAGLAAVIVGCLLLAIAQKFAADFVLRYSLEDEVFFRQMRDSGVLTAERTNASG